MKSPSNSQSLLQQVAQIQRMERGKLSIIRQTPNGPLYNLQCWHDGKNVCRYVPRDQAPAVQAAIDGFHQFQQLSGQYAQQIIARTRAELAAGSKKKNVRPNCSSHRTLKSSN